MLAIAALTGPLPKAGVIAAGVLAALVLVLGERRARAAAMAGALVLAPVLLLADIWSSPQLAVVHRHPLQTAVGAAVALALVVVAAAFLTRRPAWFAVAAVIALPFRVPIAAGGTTANLLVPLYLVVAVGALAWLWSVGLRGGGGAAAGAHEWRRREPEAGRRPHRQPPAVAWAERLLALYLVLYAVQAAYSTDFRQALQNMVFFYVPFTLLYRLLRELEWTPALLRRCLVAIASLAVVFAVVGYVEYATRTLLLNPKLVVQNNLHPYFAINSVFFDPDIFGRFLALVMVLLAVQLIYTRPPRLQVLTVVVLALLWVGLLLTLSRSSLAALLVGLGVLAALRWKPGRAVATALVVVAAGAIAVAASPRTFGLNQGINGATSGRGGLVSGGLSLFGDRPVYGWGSGSFVTEYRAHHFAVATTLAASHTIPVTIAAEQGVIGELPYIAFVLAALAALIVRARGDPARSALAAAFVALVFHTMLYADFLEDPTTWTLLGIGFALAAAPRSRASEARTTADVRPFAAQAAG